MDFNSFDNRSAAEEGSPLELVHPFNGEPIKDANGPSIVFVRGVASRSVQAAAKAKLSAAARKHKSGPSDESRTMEDIHKDLCASAKPLIVGFQNIDFDGVPATLEDVDRFLDLTFPHMGVVKDENGKPVLDEDGKPDFEMQNNPFAKQIAEFAGEQRNFMKKA